jgi:SOUL heme-binding protein
MRKFILITISIFSLISTLLVVVSFTSKNIETPSYRVLKKYDDMEIRLYPKMIVAETILSDNSFDNQNSKGFRRIADYIFGGNEKNEKIAMTSPVVINLGDKPRMYFVMPKQYLKDELPKPISKNINIVEEAEKTLAVITFGGYSSDKKIEYYCNQLDSSLNKNNIKTTGGFMFMGYNAPWDLVNRRNEVAIEISSIKL